jgi:NADH:ubiquinone oxidoreductase subunit 6 (subunit J)
MKDQLHRSATLLLSSALVTSGVAAAMGALSQEGARAAVYALCAVVLLLAAALGLGRRIADWRLRSGRGLGFITVGLILGPLILAAVSAVPAALFWMPVAWGLHLDWYLYLTPLFLTLASAGYLAITIYNAVKLLGGQRRTG